MQYDYVQRKHVVISTLTNSRKHFVNPSFITDFQCCDEVFIRRTSSITEEVKRKALMLYNNCLYQSRDNGTHEFHFDNGLDIIQLPCGHTRFVKL